MNFLLPSCRRACTLILALLIWAEHGHAQVEEPSQQGFNDVDSFHAKNLRLLWGEHGRTQVEEPSQEDFNEFENSDLDYGSFSLLNIPSAEPEVAKPPIPERVTVRPMLGPLPSIQGYCAYRARNGEQRCAGDAIISSLGPRGTLRGAVVVALQGTKPNDERVCVVGMWTARGWYFSQQRYACPATGGETTLQWLVEGAPVAMLEVTARAVEQMELVFCSSDNRGTPYCGDPSIVRCHGTVSASVAGSTTTGGLANCSNLSAMGPVTQQGNRAQLKLVDPQLVEEYRSTLYLISLNPERPQRAKGAFMRFDLARYGPTHDAPRELRLFAATGPLETPYEAISPACLATTCVALATPALEPTTVEAVAPRGAFLEVRVLQLARGQVMALRTARGWFTHPIPNSAKSHVRWLEAADSLLLQLISGDSSVFCGATADNTVSCSRVVDTHHAELSERGLVVQPCSSCSRLNEVPISWLP